MHLYKILRKRLYVIITCVAEPKYAFQNNLYIFRSIVRTLVLFHHDEKSHLGRSYM